MCKLAFLLVFLCSVFSQCGCQPPQSITTVAGGVIEGHGLATVYVIVKFPSGRCGVAIVARSKGTAPVTPSLAAEGIARVWIDKSVYEFPFSGEDVSDERMTSILEKAIEQHAKSKQTPNREIPHAAE